MAPCANSNGPDIPSSFRNVENHVENHARPAERGRTADHCLGLCRSFFEAQINTLPNLVFFRTRAGPTLLRNVYFLGFCRAFFQTKAHSKAPPYSVSHLKARKYTVAASTASPLYCTNTVSRLLLRAYICRAGGALLQILREHSVQDLLAHILPRLWSRLIYLGATSISHYRHTPWSSAGASPPRRTPACITLTCHNWSCILSISPLLILLLCCCLLYSCGYHT